MAGEVQVVDSEVRTPEVPYEFMAAFDQITAHVNPKPEDEKGKDIHTLNDESARALEAAAAEVEKKAAGAENTATTTADGAEKTSEEVVETAEEKAAREAAELKLRVEAEF